MYDSLPQNLLNYLQAGDRRVTESNFLRTLDSFGSRMSQLSDRVALHFAGGVGEAQVELAGARGRVRRTIEQEAYEEFARGYVLARLALGTDEVAVLYSTAADWEGRLRSIVDQAEKWDPLACLEAMGPNGQKVARACAEGSRRHTVLAKRVGPDKAEAAVLTTTLYAVRAAFAEALLFGPVRIGTA